MLIGYSLVMLHCDWMMDVSHLNVKLSFISDMLPGYGLKTMVSVSRLVWNCGLGLEDFDLLSWQSVAEVEVSTSSFCFNLKFNHRKLIHVMISLVS